MKIIQPTYTVKLPGLQKAISYRPFTIKEEKSLLLALEENDLDTVAAAISETVAACTDGKFDVATQPYYLTEFLFLHIRSKSVGEYLDLIGTCSCKHENKFTIDISSAKLSVDKIKTAFKIPDTKYTLTLRHPSIIDFIDTIKNSESFDAIANCVIKVTSGDEDFEWSHAEKVEFIESMTPKQQKEISKFIDEMPMVQLDATYTCQKCGSVNKNTLSGFENFFV